jgi:tetratricopeptide (TPR) repeat protein
MKPDQTKILSLLLVAVVYFMSCSHIPKKINPQAKKLNDSAMKALYQSSNLLDKGIRKYAIRLLNEATAIDTDYFTAYWNKVSLQRELGQNNNALKTAAQLLRLKPESTDVLVVAGQCYDEAGDTLSASKYYKSALSKCNALLDTMNVKSKAYTPRVFAKVLNLILLNRRNEANVILNKLSASTADTSEKKMYKDFMTFRKSDILFGKTDTTARDANPIKH